MGCLSRIIVTSALLVQVAAAVLGMMVLGMAGVLGEAAIILAEDAVIMFVLLSASLASTFVLAIKLLVGSRSRRRLAAELAAARTAERRHEPGSAPAPTP